MTDQQHQGVTQPQPLRDGHLVLAGGETISSSLHQHQVGYSALRGVRRLVPSAARTVDDRIGNAVGSLLDIDLGDAFLGCWRRYAKVMDAVRRTAADPSSEEVVVLDRHRISSSYKPHVSVYVDQVRVHTFEFDLSLVNDIIGVAVEVRGGRLVAARGGSCHTVAKLALDDFVIQEWQVDIDLGLVVPLDKASRGPADSVAAGVPEQPSGAGSEPGLGQVRPRGGTAGP
jgi:hypothetical protein